MDTRAKLKNYIAEHCVSHADDVLLTSGKTSQIYFDLRGLALDAQSAPWVSDLLLEKIKDAGVTCVGGMEAGAIPFTAALCTRAKEHGQPLHGFFVRKQAREHGKGRTIEGHFDPNAPVAVVDDVATTGGSILKTIAHIRADGGKVTQAFVVVDRDEGAAEKLAKEGVELVALFSKADFC